MRTIFQHVGYGLRMLRRHSGFALTTILTLMLGIGANSVVFPDIIDMRVAETAPPAHGRQDNTWKMARLIGIHLRPILSVYSAPLR